MTIKCSIPAQNVKILARALHTLSRIGEDVTIEFVRSEMIFKALSQAKSAYGSFVFRQDFFIDFRNDLARESRDSVTRLKLPLRFILPIFKACNITEHFLESCEIEADIPECRLHVRFVKKSRVVHSYSLYIMDGQPIKPCVGKEHMKSQCVASARLLAEIIDNFPNNVLEITIEFTEHQFFVSNHSMSTTDPSQLSHVRLYFDMNEFDHYEVDSATSLTCTLRELKGIIGFMSAGNSLAHTADFNTITGIPVRLFFTAAGDPLLVSIESPRQYEGTFVISTTDPPADPSQGAPESVSSGASRHATNKNVPRISSARTHVSNSNQSSPNDPMGSGNRQSVAPASRPPANPANPANEPSSRLPSQRAQPEFEDGGPQAAGPSSYPVVPEEAVPEVVPEEAAIQDEGSPVAVTDEDTASKRVKLPQVSLWMEPLREQASQVVAEPLLAYDTDDEPEDDEEYYHNFER